MTGSRARGGSLALTFTVASASLSAMAGCHDCDPKMPAHCQGNAVVWCSPPTRNGADEGDHGPILQHSKCGDDYCTESGGDAFCAASNRPDPLCPSEGHGAYCRSDTLVASCYMGYSAGTEECTSNTVCAEHPEAGVACMRSDGTFCGLAVGTKCTVSKSREPSLP